MIKRPVLLLIAALAFALAVPCVAQAVPSKYKNSNRPALEVQVWPGADASETVVIVSATLPDSVKLPARVRIPMPEGSDLAWAGEVLGGDPNADPSREASSHAGSGGKYVEMELSKSHQAQVEFTGLPLKIDGDIVSAQVTWVQTSDASETAFSVKMPSYATHVKIEPAPIGDPKTNNSGESLYTLPTEELEPGGKVKVSVSYSTDPSGGKGSTSLDARTILIVLGVALVLAVAGLFAAMKVPRRVR